MNLEEIIERLNVAFKRDDVKKEVLLPEWFERNVNSKIDSTGFCYSASEVIYEKTGGSNKWKLGRISQNKWENGGHCYLIDKETDKILDIAKNQYLEKGIAIPYELAHIGCGFRSKNGTLRAQNLSVLAGIGKFEK